MEERTRNAVNDAIRHVMMREEYVTDDYRRRASADADPGARKVYEDVVRFREEQASALEKRLQQFQPGSSITDDINSMFW